MSQRDSGHTRKELELNETPAWVRHVLREHLPHDVRRVWEPACGSGKMATALEAWGVQVSRSDVSRNQDFFQFTTCEADGIVTNPPYSEATRFIEHALALTKSAGGFVAMLLRTDFDHAKGRQHLFGRCPQFARKVVLTKRIRWFVNSTGQPSFNHAWYIWDWKHRGPPRLAYTQAQHTARTEQTRLQAKRPLDARV